MPLKKEAHNVDIDGKQDEFLGIALLMASFFEDIDTLIDISTKYTSNLNIL